MYRYYGELVISDSEEHDATPKDKRTGTFTSMQEGLAWAGRQLDAKSGITDAYAAFWSTENSEDYLWIEMSGYKKQIEGGGV